MITQTQIDNEAPSVIGARHFAHLLSNKGMVTLGANITSYVQLPKHHFNMSTHDI